MHVAPTVRAEMRMDEVGLASPNLFEQKAGMGSQAELQQALVPDVAQRRTLPQGVDIRHGKLVEVLGPLLEEEGLALHRHLNWWAAA